MIKSLVTTHILQLLLKDNVAIGKFDEVLKANETSFKASVMLLLSLPQEAVKTCEAYFKKTSASQKTDYLTARCLISGYLLTGQPQKCLQVIDTLDKRFPQSFEAVPFRLSLLLYKAMCAFFARNHAVSVNITNALLKTNLSSEDLHFCYMFNGMSKCSLYKCREALSSFRDLLKRCPPRKAVWLKSTDYVATIQHISLCLMEIGRKEQGMHWAKEGLNLLHQIGATQDLIISHLKILTYSPFNLSSRR